MWLENLRMALRSILAMARHAAHILRRWALLAEVVKTGKLPDGVPSFLGAAGRPILGTIIDDDHIRTFLANGLHHIPDAMLLAKRRHNDATPLTRAQLRRHVVLPPTADVPASAQKSSKMNH